MAVEYDTERQQLNNIFLNDYHKAQPEFNIY